MTDTSRLEVKTSEQSFLAEIQYEYELSPAVSRGILEAAKHHFNPTLFDANGAIKNQIQRIAVSKDEPPGRSLKECELVTVMLTFQMDTDLEVLRSQGVISLRRVRLLRFAEEAYEQGALLTVEDLALMLNTSSRTIRRDIKCYGEMEITVPTRGYMKDIGCAVSHKTKAVELYLKGFQPTEIAMRMKHSLGSIERYVQTFSRIAYLKSKNFSEEEIRYAVGISEKLVREYLELLEKYDNSSLIEELTCDSGFKKTMVIA